MAAEDELSASARSLLDVSRRVYARMELDGALEAARVPEYVDSLMESTATRFPGAMTDEAKLKRMRDDVVRVVTQAISNNTGSVN